MIQDGPAPVSGKVNGLGTAESGVLFIVASPSGGGKTTLIRETMKKLATCGVTAHFSVSHTTRPPRPAETDGVDYHFVDRSTFESMAAGGEFLEWAEYAGNLYGTSRAEVENRLEAGEDVFLDIEVQGANQVKTKIPEVVKIFVYPPSYEVLKERLAQRRQDSDDAIKRRLQWAVREFEVGGEFDYAIINDRLDEAVDALFGICVAEHQRTHRLSTRLDAIREAFRSALERDITP
jgi:guanylate kinase